MQGFLAQRGRHLRLGDQVEFDGQGAELERLGQVLGAGDGEAAGDLGPVAPVDPVRVLVEVDVGPRDQLVVQHDGEVLEGALGRLARDLPGDPALGDVARDLLEGRAALVRELHGHDRLAGAARALVELLLGVGDVGAGERRAVVEHVPPAVEVLGHLLVGVRLLAPDDHRPLVDLEHLGAFGRAPRRQPLGVQVLGGVLGPGAFLAGGVEQEVLVVDRVVAGVDRRPSGGPLHRVVQRGDRGVGDLRVRRVGFPVGPDDVGFPVVEVQLGDFAHLFDGPLGVAGAGQPHRDLVGARALDLGLGHAEGVHALADDVQRPLNGVGGDLGLLGRGLALVDQLHAALEVQAQAGLLDHDRHGRGGDQPRDQQEDQPVAAAVGHSWSRE
jgi:hypothetical protein